MSRATSDDRMVSQTLIAALVALAVPPAIFVVLRANPDLDAAIGTPASHFYVVTLVAALAMALAIAVVFAARHLPDPRTFFLAMGFLAMATIFFAHGAGTSPLFTRDQASSDPFDAYGASAYGEDAYDAAPSHDAHGGGTAPASGGGDPGIAIARGKVVGYSARLSMVVSALFFALAVADVRRSIAEFLVRRWALLLGLVIAPLAGHVFVALAYPRLLSWLPFDSQVFSWGIAGVAWAGLGFAAWRCFQAWRLARLPFQGAMAFGMVLLMEAQWFMVQGALFRLSWWEYHAVMLAGFLVPVVALLHQYRTTGDMGAVVEGLFLRQQVSGIQKGDPAALSALAAAVSAKDGETGAHIERVAEMAVAIGREMGLAEERIDVLRWAGRLHDAGKIGVPNSILKKPSRLTDAEFEVIKRHSPRGWRLAMRSRLLEAAAPIIRAHHERVDGSGYPDGLRGDEIPIEARIVAVADVWDALTSDRPYRGAMTHAQAAAILRRDVGSHFDPGCVRAALSVLALPTDGLAA